MSRFPRPCRVVLNPIRTDFCRLPYCWQVETRDGIALFRCWTKPRARVVQKILNGCDIGVAVAIRAGGAYLLRTSQRPAGRWVYFGAEG